MNLSNLLLSLGFLVVVVGGQYLLLVKYERSQKNSWKLVAEGVYERVGTVSAPISIKGFTNFMMIMMHIDTIFFNDGTTCKAVGIARDLPAPGTRVRIFKNGLAQFRLEAL